MKTKIKNFFWILTILGVLIGLFQFLITLTESNGSPQQAAGAAMSLCFAIIPYVLARAVEKIEFIDSNSKSSSSKSFLIFYIIWFGFNLYLLIYYYNYTAEKLDIFIPFQKFFRDSFISWSSYDWSEFVVYTVTPLVIFGAVKLFKKKDISNQFSSKQS